MKVLTLSFSLSFNSLERAGTYLLIVTPCSWYPFTIWCHQSLSRNSLPSLDHFPLDFALAVSFKGTTWQQHYLSPFIKDIFNKMKFFVATLFASFFFWAASAAPPSAPFDEDEWGVSLKIRLDKQPVEITG